MTTEMNTTNETTSGIPADEIPELKCVRESKPKQHWLEREPVTQEMKENARIHESYENLNAAYQQLADLYSDERNATAALRAQLEEAHTALTESQELIGVARSYFPKSVRDPGRFKLENTSATVSTILSRIQK